MTKKNMNLIRNWIRPLLSGLIIGIGIAVVPSCIKHLSSPIFNNVCQIDSVNCKDLLRLRVFLKENYPNLSIKNASQSLLGKEKGSISDDHDIFFRFLSLVSGKPTPYNLEVDHYSVKNMEWIRLPENIQLAEWYESHQDSIPCEVFSEYYNIEKGIREGPQLRKEDFNDYLKESEEYFDSVFRRKDEFEKKYSGYLSEDSIRNPHFEKKNEEIDQTIQ